MSSQNAVEIKGGMYTFMSLKIHTHDLDSIDRAIADKVQQAPGFFKGTPVVVDLTALEPDIDAPAEVSGNAADPFDGPGLVDRIRTHELVPIVARVRHKTSRIAGCIPLPLIESGLQKGSAVAARKPPPEGSGADANPGADGNGNGENNQRENNGREDDGAQATQLSAGASEVEYVVKAPVLITRPVRSGQQIYARETDLIIMGPVGNGAEIVADNNIHVYGPLRGRALCGVSGNLETRIFCSSLEAELVSVAGNYRLLDSIPEELRGKPAQIFMHDDRLTIEPL